MTGRRPAPGPAEGHPRVSVEVATPASVHLGSRGASSLELGGGQANGPSRAVADGRRMGPMALGLVMVATGQSDQSRSR